MMPQRKPFPRDTVAALLRDRIGTGEFPPGTELPTQRAIAEQYQCAENTALAALRILATEGLITVRPRRGSIVVQADRSISGPLERMRRSSDGGLFRPGEQQELLRAELAPGHPDALAAFGLAEDVHLGVREYTVRDARGTVVTSAASYVHPDVWAAVAELRRATPIPDGIIGAIRRILGRVTVSVPTRRKADFATAEEARALGIGEDEPILVEVTECQDGDGEVLEYNVSVHPRGYWIGR